MADLQPLFAYLDLKPLVRSSRFSLGPRVRARGVPAVLVGVAAMMLAAGVSRTLQQMTSIVPESLREAREFWLAVRAGRRDMLP